MTDHSHTYQLKFEERPGYLYAVVRSENIDLETALSYLSEVANKCEEINIDRLLLERDVPVMLPAADLFFIANAFLEMIKGRRVAFVNRHSPIETDMKFLITIGTNRGAHYKLFDDVEAAEKWLMD